MFIPLYDDNALRHIPRPYVNWTLIAVTVAFYFVFQSGSVVDGYYAATLGLGLTPAYLLDGLPPPPDMTLVPEWATVFTYALVHGDMWHLAGNMVFLWVFGDNVEDAVGHVKYAVFYALCAAAGGLAHAFTTAGSADPLVGASGAVAGVIAAYLMLHPRVKLWILVLGRIPLPISARWPLLAWVGMQVVAVLAPEDDGVAWWAHLGGLAAGAVLILVLRRPGVRLFDRGLPVENPA